MLEVELKARVADLSRVRQKLTSLHAEFEGRVLERDLYLDSPSRDFRVTDEALRLREADGRFTLTYKGQRRGDFALKAREELSCGLESGETMRKILLALGFSPVAEVVKSREYFRLPEATVTLDQVEGLGDFVEIEMRDPARTSPEDLIGLARDLGVTGEPIHESYLELLEALKGR
ncbi:MAG: class IV adenylate cyclase [Methanolinea sp.]|nr:class IV adenylate cyclase [Methanolinea sp.]